MKKSIPYAIGFILLAALAVWFFNGRNASQNNELKLSGTIEVTSVEVSFKVGGRMTKRLVNEGENVKDGQLLAILEDDELKLEYSARSAEQQAAQASLADLKAGSRNEEIAQGEAAVARFKAEANRLSRDAARMEQLYKREVIPLKELEAARAAKTASTASLHEAEQRLALLRNAPRTNAIKERQARAASASAAQGLASTRLSQSKLRSPLSGVVLSKHAENGEMLSPGAPVVTVGKLDEVWLRGYIPEADLGRIRLGQKARLKVDGWPDRIFPGTVTFISQQAEFTPKNVQTEKERVKLVYRIKITVQNPDLALKPGMPADATVILDNPKK